MTQETVLMSLDMETALTTQTKQLHPNGDNAWILRTVEMEGHTVDVVKFIYQIPKGGPYGHYCQDCRIAEEGFGSALAAEDDAAETHEDVAAVVGRDLLNG